MLRDQSVNVHQLTSTEAAAPFTYNRFEPKFCRAGFPLHMHMPRFSSVVRVKEKAVPALAENRRHSTSLVDHFCNAKSPINYRLSAARPIQLPASGGLRAEHINRSIGVKTATGQ
jgi:hypothetical protein